MKKFTITKEQFINWYFNTGADQDQERMRTDLGDSIIEQLLEKGCAEINVTDIFEDEAELSCIPIRYTEEASQYPQECENGCELGELDEFEIKLVDNK